MVQYWNGIHKDEYFGGFTAAFDTAFLDSIEINPISKARNKMTPVEILYLSMEGAQTDVLPYHSTFRDKFSSPNEYTKAFAEFAARDVPWAPIQSMYKCQQCRSFVMLYDFNTTSNRSLNGLQALIPSAVSLGLMGYPFIIPGAIGGSNYTSDIHSPSKGLYIRWMQLVTFFPVMHFSIPPDSYDVDTVEKAKALISLHDDFVVPEIQKVLINASHNLYPIIRPLWWFDPKDQNLIDIEDQFMLGDCVMVAPVLKEGYMYRDIYFPKGSWMDKNTNTVFIGPKMESNYPADLNIVPYFQQLENCT